MAGAIPFKLFVDVLPVVVVAFTDIVVGGFSGGSTVDRSEGD
jgi:hypothetical protein